LQASDLIPIIQKDFNELLRDYTQFLSGAVPLEPMDKREALMEKVKVLRNMTKMRTEENFLADNTIARIMAHVSLWERQLQARDGRRKVRKKIDSVDPAHSAPPKEKIAPSKVVRLSDPARERAQVVELFEEYVKLNLMTGNRQPIGFGKFQTFLQDQTNKILASRKSSSVAFEVILKDDKVVLKTRSES
jgi:hypothetical protein